MKKIIVFWIIFLCCFTSLSAQVVLKAPSYFIENEPYYFSLEASGNDINFPTITKIDGLVVESAGKSSNYSSINGVVSNQIVKRYKLLATQDFTIPSFEFVVDGQTLKTQSKTVKKQKIQQTKSDYFEFNLKAAKNELFVGESTIVTLQFKYRQDVKIMDFQLNFSGFENFWHKTIDKNRQYEKDDFIIQELDFLVFPQKSGHLTINPLSMDVVIVDNSSSSFSLFTNAAKRLKLYSNELAFNIKALPQNVELVGQFAMTASADKTTVKQGESINFKVHIDAIGNLEDIHSINLDIPNTTVYANKPTINTEIKNNQLQGSYEKTFSIIANENFTIPSMQLDYYDLQQQKVVTLKTTAIFIEVESTQQVMQPVKLEKQTLPATSNSITKSVHSSVQDRVAFFILGVLVTLLSIGLYFYVINKRIKTKEDLPLLKRIKAVNNNQELLFVVLPYIDYNEEIKNLVFQLENSPSQQVKENKKAFLTVMKKYQIKG